MEVTTKALSDLTTFLSGATEPGIEIYAAKLQKLSVGYHFEVILDNREHPLGAVSSDQCERFSRGLGLRLDEELGESDSKWADVIPADLTIDNYSIEVSSAGAERELRLPDDLERFKGRPLKIVYRTAERQGTEFAIFMGGEVRAESDGALFQKHLPRKDRKRLKKTREIKTEKFWVSYNELVKVELYLDF